MANITERNGHYRIRVSAGYDINGKQLFQSVSWTPKEGMTPKQIEKELKRQAVLFEENVKNGQYVKGDTKFTDFANKWMSDFASSQLTATTYKRYSDCLKRINPAIGHIKLSKLQPTHLNAFYKSLMSENTMNQKKYRLKRDLKKMIIEKKKTIKRMAEESELSESTIRLMLNGKNINVETAEKVCSSLEIELKNYFEKVSMSKALNSSTIRYYHSVISSILSTAVQWQIITSNPCERVKPPKIEHKEASYLEEDDALRLLALLEDEPILYRTLFTVILYTGMRRGEALGLTWDDIDFTNGLIDINKSSLYLSGKGIFDSDTKTKSSHRIIRVPETLLPLLKQYKIEQSKNKLKLGDAWKGSDKVFTSEEGASLHPDAVSKRYKEFAQKNDLPNTKIHGLRHTNATLMIANGTDIKTVSKRLGHANVTTTGNIYTHAIKSADEKAADALNDLFTKSKLKNA